MAARQIALYRLLLRVFPPAFRQRFADDMAEVFADRRRAARRAGRLALLTFWWRTTIDLVAHAAAEHRQARDGRSRLRGSMRGLLDDFKAAIRGHRRHPGLLLLAAPMLALGIGFNTALFAVVHDVILKPLPYAQPDRVVMLWTGQSADGTGFVNSYADYADWKTRSQSFTALAAYNISLGTLTDGGDPEEIGGAAVSPEFFGVLGAQLELGRGLQAGDERIATEQGQAIVLADSLWARRFHRDPGIIGRAITLDNTARRVVGIVSAAFVQPEPFWGERTEYWTPLAVTDSMRTNHGNHFLRVIGRLAPSVTLGQARTDLDAIGRALMQAYPSTNARSVIVIPVTDQLKGTTRRESWIFLGAAALVLTLGIANIVNLLLARANDRRAELTVRTALGATRARLVGQLVADSTIVGVAGGLLGLLFAVLGLRLLLAVAPPEATGPGGPPGLATASIGGASAAFAVGLSILTGVCCGLVPAWRVGRARLGSAVGARGSSGLEASRARRWIVSAEIALALPLVVGATLLTRTLVGMERINPGFDPTHALQFRVSVSGDRYAKPGATVGFFATLLGQLRAAPGVTAAGIVSSLPMGGLNNTGGTMIYEQTDGIPAELSVGLRVATGGYFPALGIPLERGRLYDESAADTHMVVVNDRAAARMWGEANPIGRRLRYGSLTDPADHQTWLTVVGVVGSLHHEGLTRAPVPEVFQPYQANPWWTMTVVLRGPGEPDSLGPAARAVVRSLDRSVAVVGMAPVSDVITDQLAAPQFGVVASVLFGALGLALAAFGLFAVLSLSVAQRTREIGIRMALGATRRAVGRLLIRESLVMIAVGCLVGSLAAFLFSRALATQLFGVTAHDGLALGESIGVLLVVAIASGGWPARRAMRIDPVTALRAD